MPDVAATAAPHPKSGVMAEAVASLQAVRSQIHVGSLNTGTFKPAFKDGSLPSSRFRSPVSVARIPGGRGVVIADTGNNAIREIILAGEGVVRTLPGGRWLRPTDLCSMSEGFAVCDSGHHRIQLLSFSGRTVSTLAGCGKMGFRDGVAAEARFHAQHGICPGPRGSLIVADTGNHVIRMISNGIVTTIAGRPREAGHADGPSHEALFSSPMRVIVTLGGTLLVADRNGGLRAMHGDWSQVETLVAPCAAGEPKHRDGPLDAHTPNAARMSTCDGLCLSVDGFVVVSDSSNHCVRVIDPQLLTLSTLAGFPGQWGATDGPADKCHMNRPCGVCCLNDGSLVVADSANNALRVITFKDVCSPAPPSHIAVTLPATSVGTNAANMSISPGELKSRLSPVHLRVLERAKESAREREEARASERVREIERQRACEKAWQVQRDRELKARAREQEQMEQSAMDSEDREGNRDAEESWLLDEPREAYTRPVSGRKTSEWQQSERKGNDSDNMSIAVCKSGGSSPLGSSGLLAANPWIDSASEEEELTAHRNARDAACSSELSPSASTSSSDQSSPIVSPSQRRRGWEKRVGRRERDSFLAPRFVSVPGGRRGESLAAYAEKLLRKLSPAGGDDIYPRNTPETGQEEAALGLGASLRESEERGKFQSGCGDGSKRFDSKSPSFLHDPGAHSTGTAGCGSVENIVRADPVSDAMMCFETVARKRSPTPGRATQRQVRFSPSNSNRSEKVTEGFTGDGDGGWKIQDVEEQANLLLGGVDEAVKGGFLFLARDRLVLARATLRIGVSGGRGGGKAGKQRELWGRINRCTRLLMDLGVQNLTFEEMPPEEGGVGGGVTLRPVSRRKQGVDREGNGTFSSPLAQAPVDPVSSVDSVTVSDNILRAPRPSSHSPSSLLSSPQHESPDSILKDSPVVKDSGGEDESVMEQLSVADLLAMEARDRRDDEDSGMWLSTPPFSEPSHVLGDVAGETADGTHREKSPRNSEKIGALLARGPSPAQPLNREDDIVQAMQETLQWRHALEKISRALPGYEQSLMQAASKHISSRQTSPEGEAAGQTTKTGTFSSTRSTGEVELIRKQITELLSGIEHRMKASEHAVKRPAENSGTRREDRQLAMRVNEDSFLDRKDEENLVVDPVVMRMEREVQDILVSREIESERLRQIEMESADKNDKEEQVLEQGYNDRSQINHENMEPRVHDRSDATMRGAGGEADGNTQKSEEAETLLSMGCVGEGGVVKKDGVPSVQNHLGYYRRLTASLSPQRSLCEWQLADWRGITSQVDGLKRFLVQQGSVLWLRLSLWGFDFQDVAVFVNQHRMPISGRLRYDADKRASYVMLRLTAPSASDPFYPPRSADDALMAAAQSDQEREAVNWYAAQPEQVLAIRVEAQVARGDSEARERGKEGVGRLSSVELVGDLQLRMILAGSTEEIDRYAPVLKTCRKRCLQGLPAVLQPLALLSVRASARAALLPGNRS